MSFNIFKSTLEGLQKLSGAVEKTASPIQRVLNIQKPKQSSGNIFQTIAAIQQAKKNVPAMLNTAQKLRNDVSAAKPYIQKGIQKLQTPQARAIESFANVLGFPTNFTGRTNFDQIKPQASRSQNIINSVANATQPFTDFNKKAVNAASSLASPYSALGFLSGRQKEAALPELTKLDLQMKGQEVPEELQSQVADIQRSTILGLVDPSHGAKNIAGKVGNKLVDDFSENLLQEARKYKSAEEFVKAQGELVYHGTNVDFRMPDTKKGSIGFLGRGFYVTDSKPTAKFYAEKMVTESKTGKPNVKEFIISKDANIADWSRREFEQYVDENFPFSKHGVKRYDKAVKKLMREGFDGMTDGLEQTVIYNPKVIKIKSQLTEIWNKANEPSPQALPIFNKTNKGSGVNESLSKKLASNIRTDKLGITGDSAQSELKRILDDADNFSSQRRGVQTFEMTEEAANNILPKIKLKPGTTLNAEEKFALGNLVKGYSDEIDNLAQRIKSGENNDENLLQLAKLRTSYQTALASLSGAKAEAGRALSADRMLNKLLVDPRIRQDERMLKEALKLSGGREGIEKIAKRLGEFGDDTVAKYKFIKNISRPNIWTKGTRMIDWYYYNSLLSGFKTQIRNTLGNGFHLGFNLASKPFAGAVDATKSGAYRLVGKNRAREVYAGELPSEIKGMITGIPEAYRKARFMMKNGFSLDDMVESEFAKPEMFSKVFGGKLALPANIVSRSMQSTDQFFRTVVANSELHSLAYKNAKNKGLKGDEYKKAVEEFIDNPPIEAVEAMRKAAETATFQNPNKVASGIDQLVKNIELEDGTEIFNPLKLIVPFVKTPTNIIARSAEATPLGLLTGALRSSGRESSQVMGKALLGSIGLASLWTLAQQGAITGSGPKDKEMRDALYATGWRPNSVKIGDKYYNFQLFAPLAQGLSVIGNANDQNIYDGVQPSVSNILFGVGNSLTQNSFLEGLDQLNQAIQYQDASYITKNVAGAAVPFSALLRTIAIGKDNKIREAGSLLDSMKANIPGLREDLPVKKDIFGRDLQYEGGVLQRMLDPFNTSSVKTDRESELANETLRLGVKIQSPENKQKLTNLKTNEKIELNSEQKNLYSQQLGEAMRNTIDTAISSSEYQQMTDDEKRVYLEERISDAKKYVDSVFFIDSLTPDQKKQLGQQVVEYNISVPSQTKDIEAYDVQTGNKIDFTPEQRSRYYEKMWGSIYDAVNLNEQRKEFGTLDIDEKSKLVQDQVSQVKSFMREGFTILEKYGDQKFNDTLKIALNSNAEHYLKYTRIENLVTDLFEKQKLAKEQGMTLKEYLGPEKMKEVGKQLQAPGSAKIFTSKLKDKILSQGRNEYELFLSDLDSDMRATYIFYELNDKIQAGDKKAAAKIYKNYVKKGLLDDPTKSAFIEQIKENVKLEESKKNRDRMPVSEIMNQMQATFGYRHNQPTFYSSAHHGTDIVTQEETDIPSMISGTVVESINGYADGSMDGGYGNYVVIENPQTKERVLYGHLAQGTAPSVGTQVKAGQIVGRAGRTGLRDSVGTIHTHLEYSVNGQLIDPESIQ